MSVRPPTSQRKTGPYSSKAEKIKSLKERSRKLAPFSPARKKIMQQIKKLETSQQPASQKFTGSGKEIGDKKTKTGQYEEKAPKVKTPIFKLKDDASERRRKKRLAEEKANREKVRLAKGRKASEKLQDIPPGRKPGMVIGKPKTKYTPKIKVKGRGVDSTSRGPKPPKALKTDSPPKTYGGPLISKPKPVSKVVSDKPKPVVKKVVTPVSKVVSDKPTVKSKPKNRLQILKERGKATSPKIGEVSTGTSTTKFPRVHPSRQTKVKPTTKKYSPVESSPKTYGGELTPKKVVKKQSPKQLAKITPRRKPIPPSVNGSKVKSKSVDRFAHLKNKKVQPTTYQKPSAKMTGKLAEKHEGDPHLIRKPKAEAKTTAKTPKKSEEGFLGFKQISGPKDWRGGIREYETPFGNITLDSSQENLTDEQKERKKLGLTYKKGGQIKVPKKKKVGKKKQGYKARKDESIAMRVKKKRTKKQLKASRSDSYGKWGKGKGKGKINRSGAALVAASYD